MTVPNAISIEKLVALSETAAPGIQELDAKDLIKLANEKIKELEMISNQLTNCQSSTILPSRWKYFLIARKSLRLAIRSLRRSIQV